MLYLVRMMHKQTEFFRLNIFIQSM